jgi:hypothetical protein
MYIVRQEPESGYLCLLLVCWVLTGAMVSTESTALTFHFLKTEADQAFTSSLANK